MILNHLLIAFCILAQLFFLVSYLIDQKLIKWPLKLLMEPLVLSFLILCHITVCFMLSPFVLIVTMFSIFSYLRLYLFRFPFKSTASFVMAITWFTTVSSDIAVPPVNHKECSFLEESELPIILAAEFETYTMPCGLERLVLYSEQTGCILTKNALRFVPTENYEKTPIARLALSHYLNVVKLSVAAKAHPPSDLKELDNSPLTSEYTHSGPPDFPWNTRLTNDLDLVGNCRAQYVTHWFNFKKMGLMGGYCRTPLQLITGLDPDHVTFIDYGFKGRQLFLVTGKSSYLESTSTNLKLSAGASFSKGGVFFPYTYGEKPTPLSPLNPMQNVFKIIQKSKK